MRYPNIARGVVVCLGMLGIGYGGPGGAQPAASGPHGGQILQDGRNQFELARNSWDGGLSLYALRAYEPLPRSMTLTLYRAPFTSQTIEFQAVSPVYEPYLQYAGKGFASAVASNDSVIGIELRFGLDAYPRRLWPVG